jgi:hypothetical protein
MKHKEGCERGPPDWAKGLKGDRVAEVKQQIAEGVPLVAIIRQHGLQDRFELLQDWVAETVRRQNHHTGTEIKRSLGRLIRNPDWIESIERVRQAAVDAVLTGHAKAKELVESYVALNRDYIGSALTIMQTTGEGRQAVAAVDQQRELGQRIRDILGIAPMMERIEMAPNGGRRNGNGPNQTRCGLPLSLPSEGDLP